MRYKVKKGVVLSGLQYEMRAVLKAIGKVCDELGLPVEITSGIEGSHSCASYHPYGYALDFSIREFSHGEPEVVVAYLKQELPSYYDVVLEHDHIHVEFDVNKSQKFGYRKEF